MDITVVHGSNSGDGSSIVLVPSARIDAVWPTVEEFFEKGAPYWEEYCSLPTIMDSLRAGRCSLWLAMKGGEVQLTGLTEFTTYPKQKVLRITWIAGKGLKYFMPLYAVIERWAMQQGANRVEVLGRLGWLRLLEPEGFDLHSFLIVKDLEPMTEH